MNLDELKLKNDKSLKKKSEIENPKILSNEELLSKSKQFPYRGFVEIEVGNIPKFLMFHNNDDIVARSFFWKGANSYEKTSIKIWAGLSKKSPIVLDVGAYTGIYSLVSAATNSLSKIYAFEALDRVYSRLVINKLLNEFANIETFNLLVSNHEENKLLNVYSGDSVLVSGSSSVDRTTAGKTPYAVKTVRSIKLDNMFENLPVTLIKIDVEGAELSVLEGAVTIIERNLPDILIEVLEDAKINELNIFFKKYNYNYYSINDLTNEVKQIDSISSSKDINSLNILITKKTLEEIKSLC